MAMPYQHCFEGTLSADSVQVSGIPGAAILIKHIGIVKVAARGGTEIGCNHIRKNNPIFSRQGVE
jgi:hypothetical protein